MAVEVFSGKWMSHGSNPGSVEDDLALVPESDLEEARHVGQVPIEWVVRFFAAGHDLFQTTQWLRAWRYSGKAGRRIKMTSQPQHSVRRPAATS